MSPSPHLCPMTRSAGWARSCRELYGRDVSVKQTVDPQVLGGMSVLVGSDLYDGTVLRRLNDTRKALSKR